MALSPGTRLGPYEIVSALGAGGMGEVYRAKDTRLGRDVALKTLPDGLANDSERRGRFEREARAASSLNHPHICAIYDVGSHDGIDYLVMELLEGETAADCLARGPMPAVEVMRLGAQVAGALDRAHKMGLVHRDLKPANIMLVRSGSKSGPVQAKLLDFGLARPIVEHGGDETRTKALTAAGTIVGTFHYMSPEQIEGREVDARSDIWSLGATLYEMATSARAFDGASTASLMSAVLRDEPARMTDRVPLTPPALQRVVAQCLAKDADDRWQSAGDLKRELEWVASGGGAASGMPVAAPSAPESKSHRWVARLAIGAAMAGVAGAAWWIGSRAHPAAPAWSQFTQLTDDSGVETGPTISPDGSTIAYASDVKGSWDIYVQRVGGRNPVVVAGDPAVDEMWPAFSPDGKQIAFNEGGDKGGLFVVGATGESVHRLTDFGMNPAWSPDGQQIVFSTGELLTGGSGPGPSALWLVDAAGGDPRSLDTADGRQASWSPSKRRIAFGQTVGGQRDLVTIPATGGPHVLATNDAAADFAPVWSPDGRFLYFASDRGGSMGIWRMGIDEVTGAVTGAPEPIAAGVDRAMDLPHLTADGKVLVFRSMMESVNPASIAFDPATERAGAVRLLQHRSGNLVPASVSPGGQWIALYNVLDRQQDIFLMKPDGTSLVRLTDDIARDWMPRFTTDGTAVGFRSNKSGTYEAWTIKLDGSGRTRLTEDLGGSVGSPTFSPDGRKVMATVIPPKIALGDLPGPLTLKTATLMNAPRVGDKHFLPQQWSRDGHSWVGGLLAPSGTVRGNAIYDIATGAIRLLSDDAAGYTSVWLPGHSRLVYFTVKGALVVQDLTSLERHEIDLKLPFPPDSLFTLAGAPDGRTLYYGARQIEANIWMVEQPKAEKK